MISSFTKTVAKATGASFKSKRNKHDSRNVVDDEIDTDSTLQHSQVSNHRDDSINNTGIKRKKKKSKKADVINYQVSPFHDDPNVKDKGNAIPSKTSTTSPTTPFLLSSSSMSLSGPILTIKSELLSSSQPQRLIHIDSIICSNLINVEFMGKNDPYVVVSLGDCQVQTKPIQDAGDYAYFDQLDLSLCVEEEWIREKLLTVSVYDHNDHRSHVLIGTGTVNIQTLLRQANQKVEFNINLKNKTSINNNNSQSKKSTNQKSTSSSAGRVEIVLFLDSKPWVLGSVAGTAAGVAARPIVHVISAVSHLHQRQQNNNNNNHKDTHNENNIVDGDNDDINQQHNHIPTKGVNKNVSYKSINANSSLSPSNNNNSAINNSSNNSYRNTNAINSHQDNNNNNNNNNNDLNMSTNNQSSSSSYSTPWKTPRFIRIDSVICSNLINVEFMGKNDPYVVISLGDCQVQTAPIQDAGDYAYFDHLDDLSLCVEEEWIREKVLTVSVYDHNDHRSHVLIGTGTVNIQNLFTNSNKRMEYHIKLKDTTGGNSSSVVGSSDSITGYSATAASAATATVKNATTRVVTGASTGVRRVGNGLFQGIAAVTKMSNNNSSSNNSSNNNSNNNNNNNNNYYSNDNSTKSKKVNNNNNTNNKRQVDNIMPPHSPSKKNNTVKPKAAATAIITGTVVISLLLESKPWSCYTTPVEIMYAMYINVSHSLFACFTHMSSAVCRRSSKRNDDGDDKEEGIIEYDDDIDTNQRLGPYDTISPLHRHHQAANR